MDKETQDLAWSMIPKETRELVWEYLGRVRNGRPWVETAQILSHFFGLNIYNGQEPAEILPVERQDIIKRYQAIMVQRDPKNFGFSDYLQGQKELLEDLFAGKCVPDTSEEKEAMARQAEALDAKHRLEQEPKGSNAKMQEIADALIDETESGGKPKLKVGALAIYNGAVCRILEHNPRRRFPYLIHKLMNNLKDEVAASDLEPYVEKEEKARKLRFKEGDEVGFILNGDTIKTGIITLVKPDYDHPYYVKYDNGYHIWAGESDLKLPSEMPPRSSECVRRYDGDIEEIDKEQELNVAELLKGCVGETFHTPICGNCKLVALRQQPASRDTTEAIIFDYCGNEFGLRADGRKFKGGAILIWPSEELYNKYPTDARAALLEWAETRKPTKWRAEKQQEYYYFDRRFIVKSGVDLYRDFDNTNYRNGNYFRTPEEAERAAKELIKYLEEFHDRLLMAEKS